MTSRNATGGTSRILAMAAAAMAAMAASGAGYTDAIDNIGTVKLKGYIGERLGRMIERHTCGTDIDYITAPFLEKTETKGWWQTEFWGKFMHSAVPYQKYTGDAALMAKIDRGFERILSSQEPSGYIGNYPDTLRCGEGWDVWGMKYTMMGLMHYYDLTKNEKALAACRRVCDYVIGELGPGGKRGRELWETGNWSGFASSSILEPVMWLYKRTDDGKYLDFAKFLVKGMEEPAAGPRLIDLALKGISVADRNGHGNSPETNGGYVMKHNRWKAYEMMSCYQGMLELYEVTGRKDLLDAALATAEDICKEEINLAGGCASSEAWFHGARRQHIAHEHPQETCVTTTWMRFCEKLFSITGDTKWIDELEKTFYNAYLGALRPDGGEFEAYTPISGSRWHGMHHCFMHTDCCTANGPRGFLCFLKEFFRVKEGGAEFNFYSSAIVSAVQPGTGKKIAFDMYSIYPRQDYVRIVSHTEGVGAFPLKLRIPGWAAAPSVKLNGQALEGVKAGAYFTLAHEWKLGDIVEIRFGMPVVAHRIDNWVAFTRGPVLLARDSRFADGDMMEPYRRGSVRDGQVMTSFSPVRTPSDDIWMAFSAVLPIGSHTDNPEARNESQVYFCDFATAGSEWKRGNYYRTWFPVLIGPADK